MNINRHILQGDKAEVMDRIGHCLNQFEKAKNFKKNINWATEVCHAVTIEELIGALVSAEQELKK
ncbi:MAG: hypothetical protein KFBDDELM_00142 [Candidatus Argoarchaeum ethanivorans]|uniref:Uncharacterized protein n=1 Tax=Candidatus Argoarchaeum ethanivorans TaxID=2608793 RepID=A0A811T0H2_9EURY|nr:MAG: hypothetical protein KFBDDELM_00142 [Candidatus Argoarchaeum ethanivorans]